jgi:hypothetical protein
MAWKAITQRQYGATTACILAENGSYPSKIRMRRMSSADKNMKRAGSPSEYTGQANPLGKAAMT